MFLRIIFHLVDISYCTLCGRKRRRYPNWGHFAKTVHLMPYSRLSQIVYSYVVNGLKHEKNLF